MTDRKPIVCLDFDGVIHDYHEGWKDGTIYGNVTPGFFRWATEAREKLRLVIYSSRSSTPEGIEAMKSWLEEQITTWRGTGQIYEPVITIEDFEFSDKKPSAFLTIDDRALTFRGHWDSVLLEPDQILRFRPWNVR